MDSEYLKNIVFRSSMVLCGLAILAIVGCIVYFFYSLAYVLWFKD